MTGDESYHADCFTCRQCSRRIEELVFAKTSQGIYCMVSYHDGGSHQAFMEGSLIHRACRHSLRPAITNESHDHDGMPRLSNELERKRNGKRTRTKKRSARKARANVLLRS